jgi:hypothetical protein
VNNPLIDLELFSNYVTMTLLLGVSFTAVLAVYLTVKKHYEAKTFWIGTGVGVLGFVVAHVLSDLFVG